ncbi:MULTISPECIES: hypothetical protein [Bacillus]|uniref:Uncharacterized protein n=1 Tax=Bacillus pseudomycoides TaxID=64104 RepID=A0AAJ3V697_9BACI|nr:hypothetical protein [Bacillus pseudomycoides]MBD5798601.1 hypothetical protein [Bacillus pseudomycoides]MDR4185616.1 hypothetical protein [Bacillus pseudomycoides]MDR4328721.1 hypothetical protein [Bacillus pseudomycoides]PDZ09554.1 hypothetical protein CON70_21700 [Bacillus pseudomycoides]PDZ71802.1 hypothetical protein CON58_21500 [Bacillus pseudomycoides]
MVYCDDEILKELTVGKIYSERQISSLLHTDRTKSLVLCDSVSRFGDSETERFQVMGKYETYIHKNEDYSYHIPSRKTMVYVIEKV